MFHSASRFALADEIEVIPDEGLEDYDYDTGQKFDPKVVAEEEGFIDPSQFEEGTFLHALYDVMTSNVEGVDVFPTYMRKKLMDVIVEQVSFYVDSNAEATEDDILLIVQRVIVEFAPELSRTHETALNILFPHAPKIRQEVELEGVPGKVVVVNRIYEDQRDNMSLDPSERDRTMVLEFDCLHPTISHQRIRAVYVYDEELALKLINDDFEGFEKRIKEKTYFRPKNIFSMSDETWQALGKGGARASMLEKTPRGSSSKERTGEWDGNISIQPHEEVGSSINLKNETRQNVVDAVSTTETSTSSSSPSAESKPKSPVEDMYSWKLDPNCEYYPFPHPDQVHPAADLIRVYPHASVYMMTMMNDLWGTLMDSVEVQEGRKPENPDQLKRRIMTYVAAAGERAQSMEFINDMFEKLIKNTASERIYSNRSSTVAEEVQDFEARLDPSKPYIDQNPEFEAYIDGFDAEDPTTNEPLVRELSVENEDIIPRKPKVQMTVRQFITEVFGTEKLRDLETYPYFPVEIREAQKKARLRREAYQNQKMTQKHRLRKIKRAKDPLDMMVDPSTTVFRDDIQK